MKTKNFYYFLIFFVVAFASCDINEIPEINESIKADTINFVIDGPRAFVTVDTIFYAERGSIATLCGFANGVDILSWSWIFYDVNLPVQKKWVNYEWCSKEFTADSPSDVPITVIGVDRNRKKFEKTRTVRVVDNLDYYMGIILLSSEKKSNDSLSAILACNKSGMKHFSDHYAYCIDGSLVEIASNDTNYNVVVREGEVFAEAEKNGFGEYFLLRLTLQYSDDYKEYNLSIGKVTKSEFYPGKFWGDFVDTYHRDSAKIVVQNGEVFPGYIGRFSHNPSDNPYK